MLKLSGSKRQYIIIGVAALAFILGLVLIYYQYNVLMDLRAEVEEEEIAVDAAQADLNRLLSHRDRAGEYRDRLEFARGKIPEAAREEEVLRYFQRLIDEHGLKASEIIFEEHVEEEGYTTIPLSLTLEGSYSGARKLLGNLRGSNRAIRVDEISLSRAEGGSELQISITANTFYRSQP